jgi:galactose mutarotase-like enzyme
VDTVKTEYVKQSKKLKAAIYDNPTAVGTKLETDEKGAQIFIIQDAGDGDESMAIKPWRGACKEPKEHPPINIEKPD